jgi:hypothetical protein
MIKKLAVPLLVFGLAFGACGDDDKKGSGGAGGSAGSGGSTGGSGGSTGGSGGSTGGSGGATGGSGGATGGSGGAGGAKDGGAGAGGTGGAADAAGGAGGAADGGGTMSDAPGAEAAAAFCAGYVAGSGMLAGKSAMDFCMHFETVCGFTADTYANMGACITGYGGTADANKTCRAGHLCNAEAQAAGSDGRKNHCNHAAGHVACM